MGYCPPCQWAISPVIAGVRYGTIRAMSDGWKKRLETAMEARGFSMKSLSLAAGLGETFVRDALKRDRRPTVDKLGKLADALGVPLASLVSDADALSGEEAELVERFRSIPPEDRSRILDLVRRLDHEERAEPPLVSEH